MIMLHIVSKGEHPTEWKDRGGRSWSRWANPNMPKNCLICKKEITNGWITPFFDQHFVACVDDVEITVPEFKQLERVLELVDLAFYNLPMDDTTRRARGMLNVSMDHLTAYKKILDEIDH